MAQSGPSSATISGTPMQTGNYSFEIFVQDSSNPQQSVTVTFTGTLSGSPVTPVSLTCNPSSGPAAVGARGAGAGG
jgi:hypothetical protein